MPKSRRILLAALNWGLGHASRSIPLIQILQQAGHQLLIASDGQALDLLKKNFPDLDFLELPPFQIEYDSALGANAAIFFKGPSLMKYIRKENRFLTQWLEQEQFKPDLIISDNRYGIYHPEIPSVLITHQLKIKHSLLANAADLLLKKLLKHFDECWLPDLEDHLLSGDLSRNSSIKIPLKFIGPLSQFQIESDLSNPDSTAQATLAILSGPEPNRSRLEKKLIDQALRDQIPLRLVRGTQLAAAEGIMDHDEIKVFDFLERDALRNEIEKAKLIICRSGYSSIMDLFYLKKPAILIPTSQHSEQEYLAKYHQEQGYFTSISEKDLDLKLILDKGLNAKKPLAQFSFDLKEQAEKIESLIEQLKG